MSGFTAINIEAEDHAQQEIDDTKEIQIEEALKLYQNALKLHSQGPSYYGAANDAYEELFQSEVFKYPEVLSDDSHEQLEDGLPAGVLPAEQEAVTIIPSNAADSAANSLPQLVYLAYKGRAQFVLDVARHELSEVSTDRKELCRYYYSFCVKSMQDSAKALERDDSDLDLWKKAARISDVLTSQRLARFCLESVLAGDDDTGEQAIDLSGLDEAYASGELQQILKIVGDDLSYASTTATQPKSKLLQLLQASNDAYPFLPQRAVSAKYIDERRRPNAVKLAHLRLAPADLSLLELGKSLLLLSQRYDSDEGGEQARAFLEFVLPSSAVGCEFSPQEPIEDVQDGALASTTVEINQPAQPPEEADEITKSPASFHSAPDELLAELDEPIDVDNSTIEVAQATITEEPPGMLELPEQPSGEGENPLDNEVKIPSRKRSSTAAGMDEHESRTKSKRLRARESMLELAAQEEETAVEINYFDRELLAIFDHVDEIVIDYLNKVLGRIGVGSFGSISDIKNAIRQEDNSFSHHDEEANTLDNGLEMLMVNLKHSIISWTDEHGAAIISGHGPRDSLEKSNGFALFQRHLKTGDGGDARLTAMGSTDEMPAELINALSRPELTLQSAIYLWLISLLTTPNTQHGMQSSYLSERWSDALKECVMELLTHAESYLYDVLCLQARSRLHGKNVLVEEATSDLKDAHLAELVQSIFEVQLDVYVEATTSTMDTTEFLDSDKLDRLRRWARISNDIIQSCDLSQSHGSGIDTLLARHVWSTIKVVSLSASNDKTHVLACLRDFCTMMVAAGEPTIILPNSSTMSQISIAAAEQEMRRLATLDFFTSIFDAEANDPVSIITKLEPILELEDSNREGQIEKELKSEDDQNHQLRAFLDSGDAQLKLFLWRQLQNAYVTISYTPKIVSCLLRSFEIIMSELRTVSHTHLDFTARQVALLQWLHVVDDLITKVVSKATEDPKAFEFLDENHLNTSLAAVIDALVVFQGFVCADDSIRVGQTQMPQMRANLQRTFEKSRERLRDTYVRLWTLLYYLIREASLQNPDCFEQPTDMLSEYLSSVHNALGQRQYCKNSNKLFVRLAKQELLAFRSGNEFSLDLAQILYDMYQIKFGVGIGDADHGCIPDLLRDKATAMTLVPIIMAFATRLNVRDLVKSDLKPTIDKIQQSLGQVRPSTALKFNKAAINSFLKAEINPQTVYRSVNGVGDLITKPVDGDHAKVAATGWYMLLGKITLARFKSIKRTNPTATDDLDTAITLLRNDVEHSVYSWETWYRLAQVFDAKIEDSLIWNAAKLNDSRADIAALERNSINAYTMAIAVAMRSASDSPETIQNISDMFSEFGFRLFASSRPPLDMEAFKTNKSIRHISSSRDQSMSKASFIQPFKPYAVWKFAAYLLQHKFKPNVKEWLCQYTLGKCLWKIYQSPENVNARTPVTIEDVLEAFSDSIDLVPKKEKSTEYILEPHYKLATVVHKLVHMKKLEPRKAIEYLQTTQFARGASVSEDEQGHIEWEPYILDVLNRIGRADKSNWHHRITARAAHIIYDDDANHPAALGAKHQFMQQIFTKTMTMQVWKPEYERPGRHYVYTGRYLHFFVRILEQLGDRDNMEQLVRRIRRKTTDFLDHPKIWEYTATTYLRLLRRIAKVPEGHERIVFDKVTYEDFTKLSEKVEQWSHEQDNDSIYLRTVRDAIELKKLNNSLMKGPAIDDLIGDTYACMYDEYVSTMPPEEPAVQPAPIPAGQNNFVNVTTDVVPVMDDHLNRMRLDNLLSAQTDGMPDMSVSTSSNIGLQVPLRATPPAEPPRVSTPSKPARVKTITRREVQRKAEAASNRPQPVKTPTLAKKIIVEIPTLKRTASGTNDAAGSEDDNGDQDDAQDGLDSTLPSRRPSIANSVKDQKNEDNADDRDDEADDESGLSDADGDADNEGKPRALNTKTEGDSVEVDDAGSDGDQEDNDGEEDDPNNNEDDGEVEGEGEDEPEPVDVMEVDDDDDAIEIQDSQEGDEAAG